MAKEIKARVKLLLSGGAATPAPPVGSVLGQQGIAIMEFCKQFNAQTSTRKGETVPVMVTVFKDRSFEFVCKTPPTSELIRQKAKIQKGSSNPNVAKVGTLSATDVEEIAKIKMPDLNVNDLEAARLVVAGTARSMGVDVVK